MKKARSLGAITLTCLSLLTEISPNAQVREGLLPPPLPLTYQPPFRSFDESRADAFLLNGEPLHGVPPMSKLSKRERFDTFNQSWFTAPTRRLTFNLFDDANVTIVIDQFEIIGGVEVFSG